MSANTGDLKQKSLQNLVSAKSIFPFVATWPWWSCFVTEHSEYVH